MARLPIGWEVPCELHWLAGGREGEAVSRATGGQGAAVVAEPGLRSAGQSTERDWRKAVAPEAGVGAGKTFLGSSLARLATRTRLGKVCHPIGLTKRRGLKDALGGLGGPGRVGLQRGRG